MAWIKTIPPAEAEGILKEYYQQLTGTEDNVDNILQVHSLRPHTLAGHMSVYKSALHHSANTLPPWFRETLGVYVSILNQCNYCIAHHFEGLKRWLKDDKQAEKIKAALEANKPVEVLEEKELEAAKYAEKLTTSPGMMFSNDVKKMQKAGFSDGEILEINQVVSYFNYANRTVLGLGVNTKGDVLGLSPSGDDNNWNHQ